MAKPTLQDMAVSDLRLTVEIDGEQYRLDVVPPVESKIVAWEKERLLCAVDLKTHVDDFCHCVGSFIRIAYYGVRAAGPKFTELQIEIQRLGYDVTKLCNQSALTASKLKKRSKVVSDDLQPMYQYLLDNLEELAIETWPGVSNMGRAAMELYHEFYEQVVKVERAIENTHRAAAAGEGEAAMQQMLLHRDNELKQLEGRLEERQKEQMKLMEDAVEFLQQAIVALKELSAVLMQAAGFWKQMEDNCISLAEDQMKNTIEKAMKYSDEKRLKVWTSKAFKMKAVQFYAGWVALNSVCTVYVEHIKLTQKYLYQYLRENPTYEQSRKSVKVLAKKFLTDLKQDQKAIADKDFKAQEEIKALRQ